ncbi:alpha/beta fold hydrolase, partial [Streptomyces morookaense]|uniref:alpha/beta fold hydrolase n=1 Tax=Streptomyces morookaense TaxID=1970 RepID=UPI00280A9FDE
MSERPVNTLQYRSDGPEGAPVLVLGPELGTTWHMWDRQIPELSRHRRVLRFDLPGHGGSPAEPASTVGELTDRLVATLDALGIERFDYAGCSFAAALGTDLALRHPHRLSALALLGSAARFGAADAEGVRRSGLEPIARAVPGRWFAPAFASAQPAIVDWAVQMVRSTDLNCFAAAYEALAAFDVQADLARVAAPTLVVVGADDQVTPPAQARALVAGIPDARLAVVPGACHLTPVEQPAAVTDLLVRHFTTPATATTVRIPGPPAGRAADDWPTGGGGAPAGPVPGPGRPADAATGAGPGAVAGVSPGEGAGRDDWPVPSGGASAVAVSEPARPGAPVPGSGVGRDDWPVPSGSTSAVAAAEPARPAGAVPGPGAGRDDWPVPSGGASAVA